MSEATFKPTLVTHMHAESRVAAMIRSQPAPQAAPRKAAAKPASKTAKAAPKKVQITTHSVVVECNTF